MPFSFILAWLMMPPWESACGAGLRLKQVAPQSKAEGATREAIEYAHSPLSGVTTGAGGEKQGVHLRES